MEWPHLQFARSASSSLLVLSFVVGCLLPCIPCHCAYPLWKHKSRQTSCLKTLLVSHNHSDGLVVLLPCSNQSPARFLLRPQQTLPLLLSSVLPFSFFSYSHYQSVPSPVSKMPTRLVLWVIPRKSKPRPSFFNGFCIHCGKFIGIFPVSKSNHGTPCENLPVLWYSLGIRLKSLKGHELCII